MMVVARIVTGVLLLAHGLVHLLYLAPDVPEFSLNQSWLVPETARRQLGLVLMAATVAALAFLALAVWGVPGLSAARPVVTIVSRLLSAVLLVLFWGVCRPSAVPNAKPSPDQNAHPSQKRTLAASGKCFWRD